MSSNNRTHILQKFPSKHTATLIRASDGMAIAGRKGHVVAFGEDPRSQGQRVFLDETYATMFLRRIADDDYRQIAGDPEAAARIDEVDAEPRVVLTGEDAVNGGFVRKQ